MQFVFFMCTSADYMYNKYIQYKLFFFKVRVVLLPSNGASHAVTLILFVGQRRLDLRYIGNNFFTLSF